MLTRASWDVVGLLEALYALEQPRESWYRGVVDAAGRSLDRGRGVGLALYDVAGPGVRIERLDGFHVAPATIRVGAELHAHPVWTKGIMACYQSVVCATLNEHVPDPARRAALRRRYRPLDICDQILINGANPSGSGCALYVFSSVEVGLRQPERELLSRIASHLSAAYRLQRRLTLRPSATSEAIVAVLRADGRLEHAESAAKSRDARRALSESVKRRERARAAEARRQPERALRAWCPLVDTRWSLVDVYERDGRRYVTACENAPAPLSLEVLAPRELQVVALAELGRTNKVIAYELGLVDSTVRVLMARAASKLRVRTRAELVAKYQELRGTVPAPRPARGDGERLRDERPRRSSQSARTAPRFARDDPDERH